MTKYYEVNRYEDKLTILKPVTKQEAKDLGIGSISIDDDKLNKFIAINIDNHSITMDTNGKVELGDATYYGIPFNETNKVEIAKKAKQKLDGVVSTSDLIHYIDFIDTNNILNADGYFITDKNKEEKYLEILETGDEDLIDVLEKFLMAKDRLSSVKTARTEFEDIIEDLKYTKDEDEDKLKAIEARI